jgi:Deoxyribonuclease NucA/NucB
MKRSGLSVLATAAMMAITLSLTAFTPSPGDPAKVTPTGSAGPAASSAAPVPRRDAKDPAAVKGYLERLQRGVTRKQKQCTTDQRDGRTTRWCLEPVDPSNVPTAVSKIERAATDPTPPTSCSKPPGKTNYDRFHACYESAGRIINEDTNQLGALVKFDVWATLSADSTHWLMQVGVTATDVSPELIEAVPSFIVSLKCDKDTCEIPAPVKRKIFPNTYTYFELATSNPDTAPGDSIKYTNPQVLLTLETENAFPGSGATNPLNDPFDVRCDRETYIGGKGCVYYLGTASAATFYIDYSVPDPNFGDYREVVKNDLYGMVVRDNLKHYGDIQYGNPLHRTDPTTQKQNHDTVCSAVILAKRPAGMQCDEWPYASSEEGGKKNPRYSCAFLPESQNGNHGRALNNVYKVNRILPSLNEGGKYIQGDPYWVWVLNAPADNAIPTVKQCSTY